nr:protein RALF-like 22 [Aegilops tauschii subsp. strangulata]
MAPRPAAATGIAKTTVAALLVVVVVACQLPRATGGGVTTTQAFDGTAALGLEQCAADEQELARGNPRYISYAALRADAIPCDKRGQSYYTNCGSMQQANPYRRGCSAITRCARNMN